MTIQDLRDYGANVDAGLERCMGNEAFYLRLVDMVKSEKGFDNLESGLSAHDLKAAFEAAHSLKGVLGNLSLTPLYEPISEITELLRSQTDTDYSRLLGRILEAKARFFAL